MAICIRTGISGINSGNATLADGTKAWVYLPTGESVNNCNGHLLLDKTDYIAIQGVMEAAATPFDYAYAATLFAGGFSSVITMYLVAHLCGQILSVIKRG
jgi:hypothetical protein